MEERVPSYAKEDFTIVFKFRYLEEAPITLWFETVWHGEAKVMKQGSTRNMGKKLAIGFYSSNGHTEE